MAKPKLLGAYVDDELYEAVRVRAFEERSPLSEIVRRALRAYTQKEAAAKRPRPGRRA